MKMRKLSQILALALFVMVFVSACGSDSSGDSSGKAQNGISANRDADFLPPMEIAIAPSIKDDPELVEMVHNSERAITEFSDNIERLADDIKKLQDKADGEEPSLGDGLRLAKIFMTFASNSKNIQSTVEKFETYVDAKKESGTITDEQIEALDEVGKAFGKRMEQLGEKYEKVFDDKK